MMRDVSKITCRTPTPGKKPTRIDRWKYEAVRRAIRKVVPLTGEGVPFRELPARVERALTERERTDLGSTSWYTTTVKLDLEVRRELRRIPGSSPQRLLRVSKSPRPTH